MDKNKYVKELNDLFENRAVSMINESLGRNIAKRNNLKKNDTDLSIDNKLYIDVQYSFNLQKFGDIRIDILSAFYFKNNNTIEELEKLIKKEIEDNWLIMKKKFKINKKAENNIIESHESAFIFINLDYLCKKYNIKKYTSKEEFYLNFRNELNSLYKLNKSPKR